MSGVSVLFCRVDSIYKKIPSCDVWDKDRDARNFTGNNKIVAHPPCRGWCRLRAFANPEPGEKELALLSIDLVRKNGGVLEHPAGSSLFPGRLPLPGRGYDEFGGWTTCVDQYWWGHKARKRTWLYIVGIAPSDLPEFPIVLGDAEYVCSGNGRAKKKKKEVSKKDRERTPTDFAHWLISLAIRCKVDGHK